MSHTGCTYIANICNIQRDDVTASAFLSYAGIHTYTYMYYMMSRVCDMYQLQGTLIANL